MMVRLLSSIETSLVLNSWTERRLGGVRRALQSGGPPPMLIMAWPG
ncbi:conserved hypothetical protein [Pseudomonas protegens Pf-5]|uniref:Uncharacterized protein n=1 Tax=Pseudomonas fluorescens (strain ATCC BAA-477 / NRRL B-23932 / Pf-5) TaxID=220664 RepID=Q4KDA6_PSEF5|nr:conserved hypothetical protein [Pseudomonas protegens Pf-5]